MSPSPHPAQRALLAASALAIALTSGGCMREILYFVRTPTAPMPALEVRVDAEVRRDCLLVLIPGLFDLPEDFVRQGFVADALRASSACDIVAVDANINYYTNGEIVDRLHGDVLALSQVRGYRRIWVVGISMGALGASLLASEYGDSIEGLVLIAPWLGDEAVVRAATEAGGLRAWDPDSPLVAGENGLLGPVSRQALRWLRERDSADSPELLIGVGDSDRRRSAADLVAGVVGPERTIRVPGGHNWTTWKTIWSRVLERPPWDPSARTRRSRAGSARNETRLGSGVSEEG